MRQEAHRNDTGTRGRFVVMTQERDRQERRTRTARRTVVALGATGALGAAGAIGFGIASAQGTDATTPASRSQEQDQPGQDLRGDDSGDQDSRGTRTTEDQPPLAGPGNGGTPQGTTGGS